MNTAIGSLKTLAAASEPAQEENPLDRLEALRERLIQHPIYQQVNSLGRIRLFMREHAFAVWDFMSLLKRMQQLCTCTTVPWVPSPRPELSRFINEIVLGEECDEDGRGGYISHYALYLEAMTELGADPKPIQQLVSRIGNGADTYRVLEQLPVLTATKEFVRFTLQLCRVGQPHEVAAVFFYSREDIIPEMFSRLIPVLEPQQVPVSRLLHYLHRHVELDGDRHGPLARLAMEHLCEGNAQWQQQALVAAGRAIEHRLALWDGLLKAFQEQSL